MIMKDYAEPFATKKRNTFEEIVLTCLGVVSYIAGAFIFAYAILGGY